MEWISQDSLVEIGVDYDDARRVMNLLVRSTVNGKHMTVRSSNGIRTRKHYPVNESVEWLRTREHHEYVKNTFNILTKCKII